MPQHKNQGSEHCDGIEFLIDTEEQKHDKEENLPKFQVIERQEIKGKNTGKRRIPIIDNRGAPPGRAHGPERKYCR